MSKIWMGAWGVAACMVFAASSLKAEESSGPVFVTLQAGIEVDASGQVVAVEMDPETTLPVVLQTQARQTIQGWRFKPVTHEGRAVGGKTWANLSICLAPVADEYNVAIKLTGNGPGNASGKRSMPAPPMPLELVKYGVEHPIEFKSRVRYRVRPDGRADLISAEFVDADLQRRYGKVWNRQVRTWLSTRRFKPELIDGQAVATTIDWPIEVEIGPAVSRKKLEADHRERQANTDVCRAATGKPDNAAMAIDSRFELLPQG